MQPCSNGILRQVACAEATSSDFVEFLRRITPGDPWQGATLFSIACVFRCSHREVEKSSAARSRFPMGPNHLEASKLRPANNSRQSKIARKPSRPALDYTVIFVPSNLVKVKPEKLSL